MKRSEHKSYAELPLFLNAELVANKGTQDKAGGAASTAPAVTSARTADGSRAFEHGVN